MSDNNTNETTRQPIPVTTQRERDEATLQNIATVAGVEVTRGADGLLRYTVPIVSDNSGT